MNRRTAILTKLVHVCTALGLLLKGGSKLDHAHEYWPVIAIFFASGIYILAITIFHARLHHHERRLTASVYAIEAVATGIVAWLNLTAGKVALGLVSCAAPLFFVVALAVHLSRTRPGNGAAEERVRAA